MGLWENIEYYGSWGVRGVHFERASKQAIGEGSLLYMGNSLCLVKTGPLSVPSLRINVKKILSHWLAKFYRRFYGEKQFLPLWPTIQTSVNLATSWMQFVICSFNILAHNLELLTLF